MKESCHGYGSGSRSYASLSFRYLPMAAQQLASEHHAVSPSPHDSFEFPAYAGRDLCFAEDVFFDGKLLPFELPPLPSARAPAKSSIPVDHRWSPSLDTIRQPPHDLSAKSGDFRRASSASSTALKAPTTKGSMGRPPRWHLLALGGMRVPTTMEMRDIRRRQRQPRTPTPTAAAKGSGHWRREGKKEDGPWRILRSLSCNAEGSSALAVAPPVYFSPQVRGCAA